MEWMPIETAPEDELVLVWKAEFGAPDLADRSEEKWFDCYGAMDMPPTHWMPLPPPPKP